MSGKFQNFFDARKKTDQGDEPEQPTLTEVPPAEARTPTSEPARRIGRPPGGKKSNADYQQVTAYIRRSTYRRAQIRLLEREARQDFSELVEELLTKWLAGK